MGLVTLTKLAVDDIMESCECQGSIDFRHEIVFALRDSLLHLIHCL
jgi:hypothetical protein